MSVETGHLRVGDKVRVVGEFIIDAVVDDFYGTSLEHTDSDGRSWTFTPGESTTSIEVIG